MGFTFEGEQNSTPGVRGLLFCVGPPAVPWFIVPVLVWESVEGEALRWPRAHIFYEVLEISPAITDGDTSVFVEQSVRVFALVYTPLDHAHPTHVGEQEFSGCVPLLVGHPSCIDVNLTLSSRHKSSGHRMSPPRRNIVTAV